VKSLLQKHTSCLRCVVTSAGLTLIAACAGTPPDVLEPEPIPAQVLAPPPLPVELIEVPKVLALPGQLKPLPDDAPKVIPESSSPGERVELANAAARVEPARARFLNATQVWPYSPDALYQIYTRPERITDIALEAGETLNSVSAGDTSRWVIGDTTSGSGETERVHVLIKPISEDLQTNLVIHSDRRSYHLELKSTAQTWLAAVSWTYPLEELRKRRQVQERAAAMSPIAEGISLEHLSFRYDITGDAPSWRPLRAFDDGKKVYIQFPSAITQDEMPPLFVLSSRGEPQLVNYRVRSPYYIVDRLFQSAELRLGDDRQDVVHVTRNDIDTRSRRSHRR
jgi:type IV secretion system protein TrbG